MTVQIAQDAQYIGDGRWRWAVWIDATPEGLEEIDSVAWQLHPTFSDPLRIVSNRQEKFRLESVGWGTFRIAATLYNERGQPAGPYYHDLVFPPADEDATEAGGKAAQTKGPAVMPAPAARVFLSGSIREQAITERLSERLRRLGVTVNMPGDKLAPGSDWRQQLESSIEDADCLIAVVRDGNSSVIEYEIDHALAHNKRVFPVVVGDARIAGRLGDLASLRVGSVEEIDGAANQIAQAIAKNSAL